MQKKVIGGSGVTCHPTEGLFPLKGGRSEVGEGVERRQSEVESGSKGRSMAAGSQDGGESF